MNTSNKVLLMRYLYEQDYGNRRAGARYNVKELAAKLRVSTGETQNLINSLRADQMLLPNKERMARNIRLSKRGLQYLFEEGVIERMPDGAL